MPEIGDFDFTRHWTDPDDFPTYVGSEEVVRADMQSLFDEIKIFFNSILLPAVNALTRGVITPGSVETTSIQDGAVTQAKMAEASVGGLQLVDGSISTNKLAAAAVTLEKLASSCVDTAQLINAAVKTAKIDNGAVTAEKLGSDVRPTHVGFVVGTGDPTQNPSLISNGQVYLKIEN